MPAGEKFDAGKRISGSSMMEIRSRLILILVVLLLFASAPALPAAAQTPVVRAVLFYSPTCLVCHEIMGDFLPPLMEKYGGQLEILNIDVTTTVGQRIYQEAIKAFGITDNRKGVPTLIASSVVMVGRYEIPDYFPTVVETGLLADGVDWPQIPGLVQEIQAGTFDYFGEEGSFGYETSLWDTFNRDPAGNSIAVIALGGMVYSIFRILGFYLKSGRKKTPEIPDWVIPAVAIIGLSVSGYLSFVEISATEAFCGPVGDCNVVQQSEYARLFGMVPVGILGMAAYIVLLTAWAIQRFGKDELKRGAIQLMWFVAIAGTVFSIYLTYIEPFVIGATCIWCITSAVAMTVLLWLTTYRAIDLQSRGRRRGRRAKA